MKTLKNAGVVVLVLVAALAAAAWWYGMFRPVVVVEQQVGPLTLVYVEQTGSYAQTPRTMRAVDADLRAREVGPLRGYGLFRDNPREVPTAQLRAEVGAVIADSDRRRLKDPSGRLKVRTLKRGPCLVAEIPFRGMPSIYVGIIRVYPALTAALRGHAGAAPYIIELYDRGKTITYLIPLR
ncbi:MAG: GyrI-like domain-containing protein [bacterium]